MNPLSITLYVADNCLQLIENIPLDRFQITLSETPKFADISMEFLTHKHSEEPLLSLKAKNSGAVNIDFIYGKTAHRRQFGGGKNQPLVRAMGSECQTILDATAGMGNDGFVLANMGFQVTLCERNPFVQALLKDALDRAQQASDLPTELKSAIEHMSLITKDSADFLNQDCHPGQFDCIYMDPMYPEKKKKAATNKEMTLLQTLAGPDLDSEQLLDAAINIAKQRVIVKRPKNAPVIASKHWLPSTEISSPKTRYDIYVLKALKKR